jgi:Mn2+/Fe2+ NRAMP family transporter
MQQGTIDPYPVYLSVDYEEAGRNRLTVGFRIFTALPILIVLALLGSGSINFEYGWTLGAGSVLFLPTLLMLVFRRKYPGWWFDFNLNVVRFGNRVFAYLLILRDEYPSTDEEQAVQVELPDPQGGATLNRWLPLVKWFLAIPHYIILLFLYIAGIIVSVIGWFVVLFTGRYPRSFHRFVVGILRWSIRVQAYAFVLVTDRYPPFQLGP